MLSMSAVTTLEKLSGEFTQAFGKVYGADCSLPLKALPFSSSVSREDMDRIQFEDIFPSEPLHMSSYMPEEAQPNETYLCTLRLQRLLREWFVEKLPNLMAPEYRFIEENVAQITEIEAEIRATLQDYVDFGIIKNQQKLTLESVHTQLEEQWSRALGAYKNQGAAPTGPAH